MEVAQDDGAGSGYQLNATVVPSDLLQVAGGRNVASAPELPLGRAFVSGANANSNGDEFWVVDLSAGDKLTIDFSPVNGGDVDLNIYAPGTTDNNIGQVSVVTSSGGRSSSSQFSWVANGRGEWLLEVAQENGPGSGYQLNATVVPSDLLQVAGGRNVASAPELPLGRAFVSGANANSNGDEFWLVDLSAGDKLTIDFSPVNGGDVDLNIYAPGTTDNTIGQVSAVTSSGGRSSSSQFNWVATRTGKWLLEVAQDNGPGSGYQLRVVRPEGAGPKKAIVPGNLGALVVPPPAGFTPGPCSYCGAFNLYQYAAKGLHLARSMWPNLPNWAFYAVTSAGVMVERRPSRALFTSSPPQPRPLPTSLGWRAQASQSQVR